MNNKSIGNYDFDTEINRYNTNSLKYDFKADKNKPNDVFPMWVADMDFRCCDEIIEDMHKKVEYGIFGYTNNDTNYFNAIYQWYRNNFNVELKQEWLIPTPGVIFAISTALKALTKENDYVLINNPVHYPFTEVVEDNKRKIISSDLKYLNEHYEIDFVDFEEKIKQYNIKLYLLCSPHNPVGRVWTKNELDAIISICKKYDVYIISDEIYSDFTWNCKHINLLTYTDYIDHIILCTAPTKTFNLAGLQIANIFIPNSIVRQKFQQELWNTGYSLINVMGLVACQSAYQKGQKWLNSLKEYLLDNINLVNNFLKEKLPKIKLIYPEGTYLLWLDFSALNITDEELQDIMLNKAKLWVDNGKMFGKLGEKFQRINIALPRAKLQESLYNLESAFKDF